MANIYHFFFGPPGGGWAYPFLWFPGMEAFVVLLVLFPLALVAALLGSARISTHERQTLVGFLIFGFFAQLALRSLAPTTLAMVVDSPGANGFLGVARTHGAFTLLSQFDVLVEQLPMHARANLPGKALLFHGLLVITESASAMALLIVTISTLGAALVYFLAREWFADRQVAFYAAVFYVFLPARIYFLPVMNVVTPVLALVPMCLLELYFSRRRPWLLVACGVVGYGLILFEPLPLALAPLAMWQVARRYRNGELGRMAVVGSVAYPMAGLVAVYFLMKAFVGFDLVTAFLTALDGARDFNAATARPYGLWVRHNLKDFFLHMGIAQSALFFAALWTVGFKGTGDAGRWLILSFAAVLLTIDVLGVNRGEVVRLWIFLGVVLQIIAARQCARRFRVFALVLGLTIAQTALLMPAVGWVEVERPAENADISTHRLTL